MQTKLFVKLKDYFKDFFKKEAHEITDWYLIGSVFVLIAIGMIMLSSAGVALGWQKFHDSYYHVKHQLIFGLIPGLTLFWFLSKFNYRQLKNLAAPMLFISIVLLILVFIPGIGAPWGTAHSWISVFGFSVQPSEIVKLTFLIYLAAWLSSKERHHLKDFSYGFIPFIVILALIAFLLILQPDTGTMMIIVVTSLIVYFVAGGRPLHLTWLGIAGAVALSLLIKLSPYRAARLTTFLHPELDPLGIGYHINQALVAVGSGGWFGRGYGHSRQKFDYLPEVAGDSIFAVISEELGFFLASAIVGIYLFFAVRGFKLAQRCDDQFGQLLVAGIVGWFVVQAFFNIGAIIGILPLTGIPLPFISYGGTSLIICLAATGILANVSRQNSR